MDANESASKYVLNLLSSKLLNIKQTVDPIGNLSSSFSKPNTSFSFIDDKSGLNRNRWFQAKNSDLKQKMFSEGKVYPSTFSSNFKQSQTIKGILRKPDVTYVKNMTKIVRFATTAQVKTFSEDPDVIEERRGIMKAVEANIARVLGAAVISKNILP